MRARDLMIGCFIIHKCEHTQNIIMKKTEGKTKI